MTSAHPHILPFGVGAGPVDLLIDLVVLAIWITVVVAVVQMLRNNARSPRPGPGGPASALEILEQRYARGEISREDFLERRAVLQRGDTVHS